MPTLKE